MMEPATFCCKTHLGAGFGTRSTHPTRLIFSSAKSGLLSVIVAIVLGPLVPTVGNAQVNNEKILSAENKVLRDQILTQQRKIEELEAKVASLEAHALVLEKTGKSMNPASQPSEESEIPAEWIKSFEETLRARRVKIEESKKYIQELQSGRVRGANVGMGVQIERQKIEELTHDTPEPSRLRMDKASSTLEINHIGIFPNKIEILQILDGKNMIGKMAFGGSVELRVWISKVPTDGLVDGSFLGRDRVWLVVGTKTYSNVMGANSTVFVIEPLDLKEWQSAYEKWMQSPASQAARSEKIELPPSN